MRTNVRAHRRSRTAALVALLVAAVGLVALGTAVAAQPAAAQGERLVLAFYYTWFDEHTWSPAKVPDLPLEPYASRDRRAMDRHIAQAQTAGIDAFVVSWYGPWGGVNNQTESNFAALLDVAAARGFRVALDVEATSPFVGSSGAMVEMLRHALHVHAAHPAYLRVGGRPVLFFWRQQRWNVDTWQWIRSQVDPDRRSIWIAEGVDMAYQAVFDGHHLYTVTWTPPTDVFYTANKFSRLVQQARERYGGYRYWVATVMPGYDDTRTGRPHAFARPREGGAYYARTWEAAIASNPDWIIVTSFNEWPEGTYIEPSRAYGDYYLQLTAQWSARFKGLSSPLVGEAGRGPSSPLVGEAGRGPSSSPVGEAGRGLSTGREAGRGTPTPDYPAVWVRASVLNVRAAPSTDALRIAQLPGGEVRRAVARLEDGSWWLVCCVAGRYGWVSGRWVTPVGPAEQLARLPIRPLPETSVARKPGPVPQ
ncbi:MAG: endo-1,3-alpha-glucanase family glycosylhydrolase [Caldilineales bacterium]|nr:endo-1,3-alpha-glucanase family glycosylhydrolase [Caldilineales bacterium]MDW8316913.1 endo-1,3-alpha-glucanase family glycosylhydrolase [Anaerolineae bacterium]